MQFKAAKSLPFFFGWLIVGVCFLVTAIRSGVGTQTLGFIIRPMQDELGWAATAIATCITAQHVFAAIVAPAVGKLLDRYGGRAVITAGAIIDGIALILVSQVTTLWQFGLVMATFGGVAEACIGNAVLMPFVSKWFVHHRGLAIGVVSAGASFGGVLISPIIVAISEPFGWRAAWFCIGLIPLVLLGPLAFFILRSVPEAIGLSPDGKALTAKAETSDEYSFTLKQALRTSAFWKLVIAWNLSDFAIKGAMLNKIPYALEMGFTQATVAGIISVYGISAMIGKLSMGWMVDRFKVRKVGIVLAFVQAGSLFLFIDAQSQFQLYFTYGILSGFSSGALIAFMPYLLARFFGRQHQGIIAGVVVPILVLSSAGGSIVAAIFADVTGSYAGGFVTFAVSAALAGLALVFLKYPQTPITLTQADGD